MIKCSNNSDIYYTLKHLYIQVGNASSILEQKQILEGCSDLDYNQVGRGFVKPYKKENPPDENLICN